MEENPQVGQEEGQGSLPSTFHPMLGAESTFRLGQEKDKSF